MSDRPLIAHHITLNIEVDAYDEEDAMEIATDLQKLLLNRTKCPYKLTVVEIDDVEEA